jgi:hypothetical protein
MAGGCLDAAARDDDPVSRLDDEGSQAARSEQTDELAPDVGRVQRWAEDHPDLYAGSWYDDAGSPGAGGTGCFVLATTAAPEDVRSRLDTILDHPDRIRVVHRRHTYRELGALRDRIVSEHLQSPRLRDTTAITTVGPDVRRNRVAVALNRKDARFAAELVECYGDDWLAICDEPVNPVPLADDVGGH